MDAIKGLKYALVMVLITSAVLLGWTTYLERQIDRKVAAFSRAVAEAKTEQEARVIIQNFLTDTGKPPVANSASADVAPCAWLCQQ